MIYNCRICGNDADWEQGHGCALATPENERHRLTLKERDEAREHIAESKAREEALEKELQQVCIDCGRLEFERDRLKGELAEARRWLHTAAQQGHAGAQAGVGNLSRHRPDGVQGSSLLRVRADWVDQRATPRQSN